MWIGQRNASQHLFDQVEGRERPQQHRFATPATSVLTWSSICDPPLTVDRKQAPEGNLNRLAAQVREAGVTSRLV